MMITVTKTEQVEAKFIEIVMKVRDTFSAAILDENSKLLGEQEDVYVPGFMPGEHYGDYLMLKIDLDTGQVVDWRAPTSEEIERFLEVA